jgi:hypothetical protein
VPYKSIAIAIFVVLCVQTLGVPAFAAAEGDLKGHVVRSRDSQPIAAAAVQIKETGANTSTDAQGTYAFEDLAPGTYTVVVTPPGGSAMQHKVIIANGKTTTDDFAVGGEMSALEQIVVQGQRTTIEVARAAQLEAPNLVNITTFEEIRKIPDVSVAEAVRRIPGISLETDEGEGRYVNCRGLDADLNSTTFGGLRLPPHQQCLAVRRLSRGDPGFDSHRTGGRHHRDQIEPSEPGCGSSGLHHRNHAEDGTAEWCPLHSGKRRIGI